jgi:hypothetical protein
VAFGVVLRPPAHLKPTVHTIGSPEPMLNHRTAQSMRPDSVCRHLKIAGRVIISRFFHVTSQQP